MLATYIDAFYFLYVNIKNKTLRVARVARNVYRFSEFCEYIYKSFDLKPKSL